MKQRPIGLYDSGAGGLTVLRALQRLLPRESFVYLADSARFPYGEKTPAEILGYNREIIAALRHAYDVKALVVACNTSSALALPLLQAETDVPLFGMIEAGAEATAGRRRLGVIATRGTIGSGAYPAAVARHNPGCAVFDLACPRLVALAEDVHADREAVLRAVRRELAPLLGRQLDALLLGCTHYPLLEAPLRQVLGPRVDLIDPARNVAVHVLRNLRARDLLNPGGAPQYCHFITTGPARGLETLVQRYLGHAPSPTFAFERGPLTTLAASSVA